MKLPTHFFVLAVAIACQTQDDVGQPQDQPTLIGSWKHASYVASTCDDPADERDDQCTGTAAVCGVLSLTENEWTWFQLMPDGSQFTESGSYTISGNYFIISGGSSAPGTKMYSISGSTVSYTQSTLTFINSSLSTGCTYTVIYSRHLQPFNPLG